MIIYEVKVKLERLTRIPAFQQKLSHGNIVLDDFSSVQSYKLHFHSTILLTLVSLKPLVTDRIPSSARNVLSKIPSREIDCLLFVANGNRILERSITENLSNLEKGGFYQWSWTRGNYFMKRFSDPIKACLVDQENYTTICEAIQKISRELSNLSEYGLRIELRQNKLQLNEDKLQQSLFRAWGIFNYQGNLEKKTKRTKSLITPEDLLAVNLYSRPALFEVIDSSMNQVLTSLVSADPEVRRSAEGGWNNWKNFICHLTKAATELQGCQTTILFRGQYIQESFDLSIYKPGSLVCWPSFVNCMSEPAIARSLLPSKASSIMFEILVQEPFAMALFYFSRYPSRYEFLLPPYTTFEVLSVSSHVGQFKKVIRLKCLGLLPYVYKTKDLFPLVVPPSLEITFPKVQQDVLAQLSSLIRSKSPVPSARKAWEASMAFLAAERGDILFFLAGPFAKEHLSMLNQRGQPLLYVAARFGSHLVAEWLLEQGADIHGREKNRSTALHGATWGQHPKVMKLLLKRGANPELRNAFNNTPKDERVAVFERVEGELPFEHKPEHELFIPKLKEKRDTLLAKGPPQNLSLPYHASALWLEKMKTPCSLALEALVAGGEISAGQQAALEAEMNCGGIFVVSAYTAFAKDQEYFVAALFELLDRAGFPLL